MKKIILGLFLVFVAVLTSCESNKNSSQESFVKEATFKVGVDSGMATRADVNMPTRYIMELYELANVGDAVSGDPIQRIDNISDGSFTVTLTDGVNYAALFWADYGNDDYTVNDLKNVNIFGQPTTVAFSGESRFTYDVTSLDNSYSEVTLTHAVAQVNFVQSEEFLADNNSLEVVFSNTYALNVDGNTVTSKGEPTTYIFNDIPKSASGEIIATSYIVASEATQTVLEMSSTFNNEVEKTISNVPFQRNYRTNLTGAFSDLYSVIISATSQDGWVTDNNEPLVITTDYQKTGGVSNCYMVHKPLKDQLIVIPVGGRINTFWGNNGYTNVEANTLKEGDEFNAYTLWYDNDTNPNISYETAYVDGEAVVKVLVPSNVEDGNVVFAVEKNGVILWSWHLWITDYNPDSAIGEKTADKLQWKVDGGYVHQYSSEVWSTQYQDKYIMDRNLGARSALYDANGKGALYYQFGRKDPFTATSADIDAGVVSLANSVNNPHVFYKMNGNWCSEAFGVNYYWNDVNATDYATKSIFDPSPLGWKLPIDDTWSSFDINNTPWVANERVNAMSGAIYPACGYRLSSTGLVSFVGTDGYYWSASATKVAANGWYMSFDESSYYPSNQLYRASGAQVRPVQE